MSREDRYQTGEILRTAITQAERGIVRSNPEDDLEAYLAGAEPRGTEYKRADQGMHDIRKQLSRGGI